MTTELRGRPAAPAAGALRAVGPPPNADVCLVGALLYGSTSAAAALLELVRDDDIESNALAAVLAAIRRLTAAGARCDPPLVLDELQRAGEIRNHNGVTDALQAAVTSGADPLAARHYGAAVVARSLRRRFDSAGAALQSAAREASEAELSSHAELLARVIGDTAARLETLRGHQT
ncbi:hypothetical protein [Mycolicibacterium pulveris]|uniref:hypothetical protein n=1 Tax=Mycolicibacterium pulveris TaxID=36813 RepID=UPI003CEFAF65